MAKKTLAIILAFVALCACDKKTKTEEHSSYKTLSVMREDRTLTSEYTATLAGQQVVEVRPQVSGLITRICIGEGQKVRRGQLLFVIDQVPYRAALAEAKASVKNAEAKLATARLNLESTKVLYEKKVVQDYDLSTSHNELAVAEATLAQARAQEETARNNLSYTEVRSPVNGVAGMINYRIGALVNSSISTPLVTVSDDSQMFAYFSLPEGQITDFIEQYGSLDSFITHQPPVELRMSNGKTYPVKGRITAVSGIVTDGTGTVTLRADFPNANNLLRAGGSGTVIIPNTKKQCIVIPQGATFELQNRIFVYKVQNGKAQSAPVTVFRINNGTEYVVEEGLQQGDTIIAEGAGLVREGAVVNKSGRKE